MEARFTVFVHLKAEAAWLALSRDERREVMTREWLPILERHKDVGHQHFDAAAFHGRVSDIEMFATQDLRRFYALFEDFRNSCLIARGYFSIVEILPSLADGYKAYGQDHQTSMN